MRFQFFQGLLGTDARRRAVRRLLLGALVLTAILGALQLRSVGSARLQGEDLQRQRAVAQATALLSAVPIAAPSSSMPAPPEAPLPAPLPVPPSTPSGRATVAPNANEPQRGLPPIAQPDIPTTLPPLQRFAKATAHERLPPSLLARYAMADDAGNAGAWDLPPSLTTAGAAPMRAGAPPRPIPDRIEGTAPSRHDTDALIAMTIESGLRLVDERDAPFRLSEVRNTPGAARAHFAPRDRNPSYTVPAGWLEVGESPAKGWRIVRIESGAVVLLTPEGNPLRLRVASGGDVSAREVQTSGRSSKQTSGQTAGQATGQTAGTTSSAVPVPR